MFTNGVTSQSRKQLALREKKRKKELDVEEVRTQNIRASVRLRLNKLTHFRQMHENERRMTTI
jgi:hypothetical protein